MISNRAQFQMKSLMSAEIDEFSTGRLTRLFKEHGFEVKVMPFYPLSAFFDFDQFNIEGFTGAEREAVRYAELAFACVCTRKTPQELVAVVIREGSPKWHAAQQVVRSRLASPAIVWRENDSLLKLLGIVRTHLNEGLSPVKLKRDAVTGGEKETGVLVQQALFLYSKWLPRTIKEDPELADLLKEEVNEARKKYWFWHEVPLKRFIRCQDTDLRGEDAELRDFWFKTSADLLVTTRGPDYLPLLCIEYDSAFHDSPERQAIDRRRDSIFVRAGIPLLRITRNDVFTPNEIRKGRVRDAISCLVRQEVIQQRYARSSIAKKIQVLHEVARTRKAAKDIRQPHARLTQKYLTMSEAEFLEELISEDWHEQLIDEWEAANGFAREIYAECGLLRLNSVEDTDTGAWAILNRLDEQDTVVGQFTGPRILLKGAVTRSFSKAQRLLAIQFAYEDALTGARL